MLIYVAIPLKLATLPHFCQTRTRNVSIVAESKTCRSDFRALRSKSKHFNHKDAQNAVTNLPPRPAGHPATEPPSLPLRAIPFTAAGRVHRRSRISPDPRTFLLGEKALEAARSFSWVLSGKSCSRLICQSITGTRSPISWSPMGGAVQWASVVQNATLYAVTDDVVGVGVVSSTDPDDEDDFIGKANVDVKSCFWGSLAGKCCLVGVRWPSEALKLRFLAWMFLRLRALLLLAYRENPKVFFKFIKLR